MRVANIPARVPPSVYSTSALLLTVAVASSSLRCHTDTKTMNVTKTCCIMSTHHAYNVN